MRKKQRNKNIAIGLIGVVILLVILSATGNLGNLKLPFATAPIGEYIQVPTFMYYECNKATSLTSSPSQNIINGVAEWVRCPDNSDGCQLNIQGEETGFFSLGRRIVYQICDSSLTNCQAKVYKTANSPGWIPKKDGYPTITLPFLTKDQRVYINYQKCIGVYSGTTCIGSWVNANGGSYYADYFPFILWKNSIFAVGRTEYTTIEQGCVFPIQDRGSLIKNVINLVIPHTQDSISSYKLEPYKTRNFIDTFIPISKENVNFVDYAGKTAYCLNRQIYSIGTIETESYTYKIVDTNLNSILGSVLCCPGDAEPTRRCNDNFQWETIQGGECSLFNPCAGADWFPSGKARELIRYDCEEGYCVPKTKIVECTSNSDCAGNPKGSVCDASLWECVSIAPPIPGGEICDNGIDDDNDGKIDMADEDCQIQKSCLNCDTFVKSKILGKIFPKLKCQPKVLQSNLTCVFSFIKLALVPLVLIFASLFGFNFFSGMKGIKKLKKGKLIAFLLSLIIAGILAWLVYSLFALGIIIFIIYLIIRIAIKSIKPF